MADGQFDDVATDRIQESILQHILSFLEVKYAIRASVLSRSWKSAFTRLQYLNFGDEVYLPTSTSSNLETVHRKIREFLDSVDRIIMRRQEQNVSIQKFCLRVPVNPCLTIDLAPYIDKYISALTACNVKDLEFEAIDYRKDQPLRHTLPEAVYAANSLHKLVLGGFKLEHSPSVAEHRIIKLSSLRELQLQDIQVDDQLLQLLIMGSPEIELLKLDGCVGFDRLQVFGLLKLKKIIITNNCHELHKIEIQAPNLEYLVHIGKGKLSGVDVAACKSLKFVELDHLNCDGKWVEELFSNLPVLQVFRLFQCEGLVSAKISSNSLKVLSLNSCKDLVMAQVDAPHLSTFIYLGSVSTRFSLKALSLENIQVLVDQKKRGKSWHNKLVEFLRSFNHFKFVMWGTLKSAEMLVIPKEVRENLCPPLYDIKHMTLDVVSWNCSVTLLLELLDTLLWIAPRLDTLSFTYASSEKTFQFIYETPADEEEVPCCTAVPFKCWRHSLKKVKFENWENIPDKWILKLKNYFVENAKLLEGFD